MSGEQSWKTRDGQRSRRVVLDQVEARLPIPADVLVVEQDHLPTWFTGLWSPTRRVILLRAGLGQDRAFTLAHELAHVLLEHEADTPTNEAAADKLAIELLARAER